MCDFVIVIGRLSIVVDSSLAAESQQYFIVLCDFITVSDYQSWFHLDARVLPPSSCQSVEAVPEEKYAGL